MTRLSRIALFVLALLLASAVSVHAQSQTQAPRRAQAQVQTQPQGAVQGPNDLNLRIDGLGTVSAPLQIVLVLTLLSFVPAALVIMTSFTRIAIVFHFLRQAIGTAEMPSNQMLVGLTLFLTAFIMAPVADRINELAVQPAIAGRMDVMQALEAGTPPLREFMLKQTRQADLALFVDMAHLPRPATPSDLPMRVVIPAYAISELKTGFQMGFFLFIPFLLIDLIVSTTLLCFYRNQVLPQD